MFPIDLGMVESRSASANDMSNLETAGPPPGYCSGMPEALNGSSAMGHHPESSDMRAVAASVTGAGSSCTHHLNPKRKYEYEIEFLRSLQSHPLSLKKPDLPDLDIVQQVPIPHREKKTNRINDCLDQAPIIRPKISTKPKNPSKSSNEYIIKEKKKSLLPLSNITENCSTKLQTIQDIEFLIGRNYTIPGTNNDDEARKRCLLFLDKDDVKELVQEEIRNHKTNNNFSLAYQVSALKGDLKETIIEASRAKQLNDWLVAMSASISREFWSKIALLYAVQLENSNEFTQAAMYYSSVHRITDAVRVLLKAGLYKESLILVKNSASFNSQLIGDILNAWAKNKESQDNLEFAAKIYAANLEPGEAARCLAERKEDPKCQSLSRILYSAKPLVINPN